MSKDSAGATDQSLQQHLALATSVRAVADRLGNQEEGGRFHKHEQFKGGRAGRSAPLLISGLPPGCRHAHRRMQNALGRRIDGCMLQWPPLLRLAIV
jgi:hypothetical protein